MPVVILIGSAAAYEAPVVEHFKDTYKIVLATGPYPTVRASLTNIALDTLYIVPGLSKPERYEIFCLARKNEAQFISIGISKEDGIVPSDKNPLILPIFDGPAIAKALSGARIVQTTANRPSKCVSLRTLGSVKLMITRVNAELLSANPNIGVILRDCEDRVIKMHTSRMSSSEAELESCYRSIVSAEAKKRGI